MKSTLLQWHGRLARVFLFAISLLSSSVFAQPTLDHTSPAAISPSKGGQITLHGTGLDKPLSLWSIPAADAVFSDATPTSATAHITFPRPISDQFLTFRLATPSGISNPILIALDDLPTTPSTGQNKSVKQPQPITLPIAIEGNTQELTSHFYKFPAHKGRTLNVDVIANRIGSRLDPLVRLLDSNGKELIFCDDDPAIAPDSRFSYSVPSDGDYILELRDAAYEGSPQHRYRMRVSEADTTETPPPPIHHYSTTLPTTTEQEPNDTAAAATPFKIPTQLRGNFAKPNDRDIYQFTAKIGDHFFIHSKTRSIGSPCDLLLRAANRNGTKLAESKTDPDEASLFLTIPEDGTYLLTVEELIGQSGPQMFYQLDVEPLAGFSLTTETEKLDIPAGGQAEFKITTTRRDYKGPITLSLESGPDFIRLINDTIPEGKNETQLKLKLPPEAPVGKAFSFRIVGKAKITDTDYSQPLSNYPALKKLFPLMHYPPVQLDGEIGLGIKPPLPTTTTAPAKK